MEAQQRTGISYDFDDLSDKYIDIADHYQNEINTIKLRYQGKYMPDAVKLYINDLKQVIASLWEKAKMD